MTDDKACGPSLLPRHRPDESARAPIAALLKDRFPIAIACQVVIAQELSQHAGRQRSVRHSQQRDIDLQYVTRRVSRMRSISWS